MHSGNSLEINEIVRQFIVSLVRVGLADLELDRLQNGREQSPGMLDRGRAAAYLSVSPNHFDDLRKADRKRRPRRLQRVNPERVGGKLLWSREALDKYCSWANKGTKPSEEPSEERGS